jgi:hypothetical protein
MRMSDIVERLRKEGVAPNYYGHSSIQFEAAAEIERLRAENARLREEMVQALREAMSDTPGWYDLARAVIARAALSTAHKEPSHGDK